LGEFAVLSAQKILMEVDDNSALIVCDPRGILGQQLMPHPIHFLNTIVSVLNTLWIICF
jgi:hypothetical protein